MTARRARQTMHPSPSGRSRRRRLTRRTTRLAQTSQAACLLSTALPGSSSLPDCTVRTSSPMWPLTSTRASTMRDASTKTSSTMASASTCFVGSSRPRILSQRSVSNTPRSFLADGEGSEAMLSRPCRWDSSFDAAGNDVMSRCMMGARSAAKRSPRPANPASLRRIRLHSTLVDGSSPKCLARRITLRSSADASSRPQPTASSRSMGSSCA
mmetsp:Transcript_18694/g.54470  ORF Transcript_18694/g.54470 Transcript_18694/m.54470 type:complete len:212 (-) Transcript_18694:623-1258(-)